MREQRLTDGWGSYYTAGRTCHLLPVARLPLPLVPFMAVITERVHGQTAPPKIPISHIKHMHTETHKLHFNLPQQAEPPSGHNAGRGRKSSGSVTFVRAATGPCLSLM